MDLPSKSNIENQFDEEEIFKNQDENQDRNFFSKLLFKKSETIKECNFDQEKHFEEAIDTKHDISPQGSQRISINDGSSQ